MKNKAFNILIDAGITTRDDIMEALRSGTLLELRGPWRGSDYSGDEYTESNQRCLSRDYEGLLEGYSYTSGHREYGLKIDPREFGRGSVREQAVQLAETLASLFEYPVYDEYDVSDLVQERAEEAWDDWLKWDLESELFRLTGTAFDLTGLDGTFWEVCSEHDIWPEAEGHRDVIFPGIRDEPFLVDLAKEALREGAVDGNDLSDLTDIGYELIGSWFNESFPWIHPNQLALEFDEITA